MMPAEYRAREFEVIFYGRRIGFISKFGRALSYKNPEKEAWVFIPHMDVLERFGSETLNRFSAAAHEEYKTLPQAQEAIDKVVDSLALDK